MHLHHKCTLYVVVLRMMHLTLPKQFNRFLLQTTSRVSELSCSPMYRFTPLFHLAPHITEAGLSSLLLSRPGIHRRTRNRSSSPHLSTLSPSLRNRIRKKSPSPCAISESGCECVFQCVYVNTVYSTRINGQPSKFSLHLYQKPSSLSCLPITKEYTGIAVGSWNLWSRIHAGLDYTLSTKFRCTIALFVFRQIHVFFREVWYLRITPKQHLYFLENIGEVVRILLIDEIAEGSLPSHPSPEKHKLAQISMERRLPPISTTTKIDLISFEYTV